MRFRHLLYLSFAVCLLVVRADAGLDATEYNSLTQALHSLKMTPPDLGFKKDHVEAAFIPPLSRAILQQPLLLPQTAQDYRGTAAGLTNVVAPGFVSELFDQTILPPQPLALDMAQLLPSLARAVQRIADAANAIPRLTPRPAALAAFAVLNLEITTDSPALVRYPPITAELLCTQANLELQDDALARHFLEANASAGPPLLSLLRAIHESIEELTTQSWHDEFQITIESPLGNIIVGGAGSNTYHDDAFLIIDVGGNDLYENNAGGANWLADRPVAIVLDLAGNDRYRAPQGFAQGTGVFGVGILVDCAGDDVYEAGDLSQGTGLFGVGILVDLAGRDTFSAGTHTQGAGTFGTGLLVNNAGDDTYTAISHAQGFGGTGGNGWLVDIAGHDTYTATGQSPCPWLPGHKFTLSQGFGYGTRPFAGGGIGLLCDLQGNDRYVADVYGQGASYWYAVGLLLDAAGDDTYDAHQYCQGAGIHLSAGILADWSGNDTYRAYAICQGGAHDYSVGMLLDRAGNDTYSATSTAQGSAINNSFALLLDRAGDDQYTGTDSKQSQAAGHDGGRREYGSVAVLLDLAGYDTYSQNQTNNTAWLKPWYGCGLDTEAQPRVDNIVRQIPLTALPTSHTLEVYRPADPHHPIERLLRLTFSGKPEAGQSWEELKHLGTQALPYLLTRLDSPNVSVRAKIEELIDHLGTNSVAALITGITSADNVDQARLCAYFLARFDSATNAIPHILPLLQNEKTQTTALYTLGHLHARAAYTPALRLLRTDRETVRLRAAQALGRIGDRRATPHLIAALDDEFWTVRYAAQDALVALGKPNIPALRRAYATATDRARPHIIEALAKLGDPRAIRLAAAYWQNNAAARHAVEKFLTESGRDDRI